MLKETQVKNLFFYTIPVIIGNILPIVALPFFTRILSVDDYGLYALAQAYAIFLSGISNFGLTIGYERNFYESSEASHRSGLLYTTILFVIAAFIFFGILSFIFSPHLSVWMKGDSKNSQIFFWAYLAVSFTGLKMYFLAYFKNMENAKSYAWYSIDENLLNLAFSLFFVLYLKLGVMGLVWGQLLSSAIVFLILSRKFLIELPPRLDKRLLIRSLKISLPLTPRIFFGVIGTQFDKYLIGMLNSIGGVGVYNMGQKIGNITFLYMNTVQNVYSPQVYKRMFEMVPEEGGRSIGSYLTPFFYLSMVSGMLVSCFAEEVIIILTPKPFHGAIPVIMILSLLYGTYFFAKQPQLIYAKKTGITSGLTIFAILLNILVNVVFIKKFGVLGAAYGTLISGVISGVVTFVISQHYYKIYWEYNKIYGVYLLQFCVTALLIILLDLEMPYLSRLLVKVTGIGVFILMGVKLKVVTRENFNLIKKMVFPAKSLNSR